MTTTPAAKVFETRADRLARLDAMIERWYEDGWTSLAQAERARVLAVRCGTIVMQRAEQIGVL